MAVVQHVGRAVQLGFVGHDARGAVADAGVDGAVAATRVRNGVHLLDVLRDDHAGDRALIPSDADRPIDDVTCLRRIVNRVNIFVRNILEQ